jgi:hypothetical protein
VGVVQLVERQVVILNVAGSSPVTHPKGQRVFCPLTFFFRVHVATLLQRCNVSRPAHLPPETDAPKAKPLAEFD